METNVVLLSLVSTSNIWIKGVKYCSYVLKDRERIYIWWQLIFFQFIYFDISTYAICILIN